MGDLDNNDLDPECPVISGNEQTVLFIIFLAMAIIGIFGNTFSIGLLSQRRRGNEKILSDVYRVYVIALAIADNGMLFFTGILRYCIISWLYVPEKSNFFYEIYLCRWHRFSMHSFHNASAWLLVVMAFDRFLAVSFPFTYREINLNAKNAKRVTIVVYVVSVAMATPFLAVGPVFKTEENMESATNGSILLQNLNGCYNSSNNCTDDHLSPVNSSRLVYLEGCSLVSTLSEQNAFVINIIFHIGLAFLVPYVALLLLNIAIFRNLHCSKRVNTFNNRLGRRITIMMLVVGCVFVVLWLPQVTLLMRNVDAHSHACKSDEFVGSLAALSGLLNSALNFFLYCMTVEKFRTAAYKSIYSKLYYRQHNRTTDDTSNIVRKKTNLRLLNKEKSNPASKDDKIIVKNS